MKKIGLWVPLLLLTGCVMVPLPSDVRIVRPGPGVPEEVAAFSGKWQGAWDGTLDHVLVVEEITGNEAVVVYAWGDSQAWRISRGFTRLKGTFDGATLIAKTPRPATATYRMRPDGKLGATDEYQNIISTAIMTRVVGEEDRGHVVGGEKGSSAWSCLARRGLLRYGADRAAGPGRAAPAQDAGAGGNQGWCPLRGLDHF